MLGDVGVYCIHPFMLFHSLLVHICVAECIVSMFTYLTCVVRHCFPRAYPTCMRVIVIDRRVRVGDLCVCVACSATLCCIG